MTRTYFSVRFADYRFAAAYFTALVSLFIFSESFNTLRTVLSLVMLLALAYRLMSIFTVVDARVSAFMITLTV